MIFKSGVDTYEGRQKSSLVDQTRFIFQNSLPGGSHASSFGVAVLGNLWSKNSLTPYMKCQRCNGYRRRKWTRRLEFDPGQDWLHFT